MRAWAVTLALLLLVILPTAEPSRKALVDPLLGAEYAADPAPIVLLTLEPGAAPDVERRLATLRLESHTYRHLDMVALRLPRAYLETVAHWPEVRTVWRNEHMRPYLDESAKFIGANVVWDTFHVRGEGVTVLVVDTGVDGTHPDVRYGENLIQNVVATRLPTGLVGGHREGVVASDKDGHGTHVAGIVAGTAVAIEGDSDAGRYRGIAHASLIVGFEAGLPDADGEPSFQTVTVLEAYDYALANQHRYDIRVVSNSWGANGAFEPDSPVNQATLRLYLAGMVVPFAAGNEGDQGPGSLNRYAVAPWVLAVGAGNYLPQRASFSSIGTDPSVSNKAYDHPDLLAPGVQITAARAAPDGDVVDNLLGAAPVGAGRQLYVSKSGSSMAAPHVSGVAALLLSQNPNLSPDEVYDILTASAVAMPRTPVWEGGVGYLSALEAYRVAQDVPGSLDSFLAGRVKYAGRLSGDPDHAADSVTVGLGNGTAKQLRAPDVTPAEFARGLVSTPLGLVVLLAVPLLLFLAFGRNDEGRIARRRGLPARPLPLAGAWTLFLAAAFFAPRWTWDANLYTGNVLVQLLIPDRLFDVSALLWLLAVVVGLGLLVWALRPGSRRVVYTPLVLLGLLLVVYGFLTLTDARFSADRAPGGYAIFIALNYADLISRPFLATIGLVLLVTGGVVLGFSVGARRMPAPEGGFGRPPGPPPRPTSGSAVAPTKPYAATR